jgi:hypothetical protein
LPLTSDELNAFANVSGNRAPPPKWVRELWALCGRRSGKSRVAAGTACYIAAVVRHDGKLAAGEVGYVLVLSPTVAQSQVIFGYCKAFLQQSVLSQFIDGEPTQNEIRLKRDGMSIVIACHPANYKSVRGRTLLACVFDESSFWRDETSANPDVEVYRAVLPALSTTGGMLIAVGSPYRRLGLAFQKYRDHFGEDNPDVLVVNGPTEVFNPTIDKQVIAQADADDPAAALSEWHGQFRADLQSFLPDELIDAAINHGRPIELPPQRHLAGKYRAFTDASAGRHDHFTLAITHRENDKVIADVVKGWRPPFDPNHVVEDIAKLCDDYGVRIITGDAYAGEWVKAAFQKAHMTYHTSELNRSEIYLEGLPLWSRGLVQIPNHPTLVRELRLLERRTARSGRDSVDHGPGGSDDYANSLFGALNLAVSGGRTLVMPDNEWGRVRTQMVAQPRRPSTVHWRQRAMGMRSFFGTNSER